MAVFRANSFRFSRAHFALSSCAILFIIWKLAKEPTANFTVHFSEKENVTSVGNKVFIFDSREFEGNLYFLDSTPKGWNVLVINRDDGNEHGGCAKCLELSQQWFKKAKEMLPSNDSFISVQSTNMIAALTYAIQYNFDYIYISRIPVALPKRIDKVTNEKGIQTRIIYKKNGDVYDVCSHFMDPYAWFEGKNVIQGRFSIRKVEETVTIHSVLRNCYRKDLDKSSWSDLFDQQAPPPYFMAGNFAPLDFQEVLVSRNAAWTLIFQLLPPSVGNNQLFSTKLLLIVQRILWETKSTTAVVPAQPVKAENTKNIVKLFGFVSDQLFCPSCAIRKSISATGLKYLKDLTDWKCKEPKSLFQCMDLLVSDPVLGIPPKSDIYKYYQFWTKIMKIFGFPMPGRVPFSIARMTERHRGRDFLFSPASVLRKQTKDGTSIPRNVFDKTCTTPYKSVIPREYMYKNMLLLITYGDPNYLSTISVLEYTHRRFFKHIVYCSQNLEKFDKNYRNVSSNRPVSHLTTWVHDGLEGSHCITYIHGIGYDVDGIFYMSDDVLINPWNIIDYPVNTIWFQSNIKVAPIDAARVPDVFRNKGWLMWDFNAPFDGKKSAHKVYNTFLHLLKNGDSSTRQKVSKLLSNLKAVTKCDRCVLYEIADIFYVSMDLAHEMGMYIELFGDNVFLEISIPTIVFGLVPEMEIVRMRGQYKFYNDRENYVNDYTDKDVFYHAYKFGRLNTTQGAQFYCDRILRKGDQELSERKLV